MTLTRVDLAVLGTDGTVGGPGGSPLSGGGGAGGGTGNVTDRGAWATATAYNLHDIVSYGGTTWRCTFAHTSTTTFDDTKWAELDQHRGAWQANVRYEAGDTVISSGVLYSAITAFTSSGSFNAANWNVVGGTSATANVTDRGAWAASTVYNAHDLVRYGGTDFLCAVAHTSGAAFDTTKWTELSQFRGAWQASTVYETGDIVAQGGSLYSANSNFTSGASFSATNWTQISGSGGSVSSGFSITATDQVFYVSKTGSDLNNGTLLSPFLTISKALSTLSANTATIYVGGGTFQENVYISGNPVTILGTGTPGFQSSTRGTTIKAPTNTSDCISVVGSGANGTRIEGIDTLGLGASWTGWGIRGAGASYCIVDHWNHSGGGTPTKTGGGGAIAIGHGEQWTINGAPQISGASQGIVLGVEGDEHYIENPHLSSCYQELFVGPYETFRSPLTASVTNSATTWPINNSSDLPASGIGFTRDLMVPPAAPVPTTSASGGTILAGVYQVEVTYANAAGETVASVSGSVTTTGSTSTITVPSPPAAQGATGWYAYVTQLGGSTYTRQQAFGSPTAIGTALTLTAPPTSTGTQPLTVGSAFSGEGIAWTGNTANSLTGVTRAVVGYIASAIGTSGTITIALPSPGNQAMNGLVSPFLINNLPAAGTLQVDSEQISYTSLLNVGNGTYNLQGVTRGANATTAASHAQYAPAQDHALASAVSHASGVPVVMVALASGYSGAWSGGHTIAQYKSASCQPQSIGDNVLDIFTATRFISSDFAESGNANTPRIRQSSIGTMLFGPAFAPQSTLTDDGTQTLYQSPNGGAVILSALAVSPVVENNLGTAFTNNSATARFGALRMSAGGTPPLVDASTVLVDQRALYYDQASGQIKGMSVLQVPAGAAADDIFYYNGSALVRVPIGTNGQVLTVNAGVPAWEPASGGGSGNAYDQATIDGVLSENFSIGIMATSSTNNALASSGQLWGIKVPVGRSLSVTNIILHLSIAGATLTSGQCFAGIYDSTGTLLGQTADQSTAWASVQDGVAFPITGGPIALTGGLGAFVYVAILANGTTMPKFRVASSVNLAGAWNPLGASAWPSVGLGGLTGQTTLPGTVTLASNTKGTPANQAYVGLT